MIQARVLRELTIPSTTHGPAHAVSAASGLAAVGDWLYVALDDAVHLACYPRDGTCDGHLVRIFPGDLPDGLSARKAAKPDIEAITRLPPFPGYPAGALLGLASGSTAHRRTGFLLALDHFGVIAGTPRLIDLSGIYVPLEQTFPALNIEGAVVHRDALILLQRGSREYPANALIHLSLAAVLGALANADGLGTAAPIHVQLVDLGVIDGVPLGITDGAVLADGRIVVSAVAENSPDTYLDGPCVGAVVGILGVDGRLQWLERLHPTHKIEGIHAQIDGGKIALLLVTDADDASIPSQLLGAAIPLHPAPFA